jgi:hypothetical protein
LLDGIYSWFVYDYGGNWVYFFLDTTKASAPGWSVSQLRDTSRFTLTYCFDRYSGLFALHLCFYYFVYGLTRLKQRCFGSRAQDDEEEEALSSYLLSTNSSMA